MPVGAIAGAAVVGGATTLAAGSKAAKAQAQGAQQAADAQLQAAQISANEAARQYDITRGDYAPGRIVGEQALYKLADMLGVGRPTQSMADRAISSGPVSMAGLGQLGGYGGLGAAFGDPANDGGKGLIALYNGGMPVTAEGQPAVSLTPGYQGFEASPGYQFRRDEGSKAIERSAAARGLLRSGATQKAIGRYVDGLASSEYDSYAQRLMSLAGVGQAATGGTAAAGAQASGQAANAAMNAGQGIAQGAINTGNARASSYANTGSAINSTVSGLTSAYLYSQRPQWPTGFGG